MFKIIRSSFFYFFIFQFLFNINLFAQDSDKAISISLSTIYSQRKIFRGALIWDEPIMAIGPSFVFYNTISLGAGGLSVFKRMEGHTLSLGLSYFDDNRPGFPVIRLKDSTEDFKNQRSSTYGLYFGYSYAYQQYLNVLFQIHKDLKAHHGEYFFAKLSTSVIPFVTLGVGMGQGDGDSNRYAYGPEANSGKTHIDWSSSLRLPFLPYGGQLIANYTFSKILKEINRNADYVRGNYKNGNISIIATWRF